MQAKQFEPPPGQGQLYIIPQNAFWIGKTAVFQVLIDGKMTPGLGFGTYLALPLVPGEHLIISSLGGIQAYLVVTIEVQRNSFVRLSHKMGFWNTVPFLELIEESEGRETILTAQRILSRPF
jgi:hypothetical protein